MTTAVTIAQLYNLTDRAGAGLTADEQQRLRDGIDQLHRELDHARAEASRWAEAESAAAAAGSYAGRAETVEARVKAALDLHRPMEHGPLTICAHCSGWDGRRCLGVVTEYPCPTVTALTEETPVVDDNCVTDTDPAWTPPPPGLREQVTAVIRKFPFDDYGMDDVSYALEDDPEAQEWAPALADATLAALVERLDLGDGQAWCRYCRRAWDSPRHRCESDAEQRLYQVAELRDRWLADGAPPLGQPINRWWDMRLAEFGATLNDTKEA